MHLLRLYTKAHLAMAPNARVVVPDGKLDDVIRARHAAAHAAVSAAGAHAPAPAPGGSSSGGNVDTSSALATANHHQGRALLGRDDDVHAAAQALMASEGSSGSGGGPEARSARKAKEHDHWMYGDGLLEYHHHVYVGEDHESQRHARSVGTMGCSVGCRGFAHESLHNCKQWANNGRSKWDLQKCRASLKETQAKCHVDFKTACHDGGTGHSTYTPQRLITTEATCEVGCCKSGGLISRSALQTITRE